jgi:hypothetical protein
MLNAAENIPSITGMYCKIHNRFNKICALAAATLILPALAYAGMDNGNGNYGQNNGNQYGRDNGSPPVPVVPEANSAWVLIPFFGAVLLYSWRQFRAKA